MRLHKTLAQAVFVLLGASVALAGGHVPETTPRPGEQRFNRFQYHSVHNAFVRDNTLQQQVDEWGAIQIELDVWYDNGEYDVQHNACDTVGEDTLYNYLGDLGSSVAIQNGIVFINFQMNDTGTGACSHGFSEFPEFWKIEIRDMLEQRLGADRFYTYAEFRDVDSWKWPSLQELLRRGKHIIVTTGIRSAESYDSWFFSAVPRDCTQFLPYPQSSVIQSSTSEDGACWSPSDMGDQWMTRHYPTAQLCFDENDDIWSDNVDNGFTFVATNCDDDEDRISDARLHPPVPTYVDQTSPDSEQLGTWGRPFAGSFGLSSAVNRVKVHEQLKGASNVPIVLEGGASYQSLGVLENDPPFMTLTTRNGPVTITN